MRIVLTRRVLRNLYRCDKAFILDVFHSNLDNEFFGHPNAIDRTDVAIQEIANAQELSEIRSIIDASPWGAPVDCTEGDSFQRVDKTMNAIKQGGPVCIIGGMLRSGWIIAPVSILCIDDEGNWYVYHMTTKGIENTSRSIKKFRSDMDDDAGPIMKVLVDENYPVRRFAIIGLNGMFTTPYQKPGEPVAPLTGSLALVDMTYEEMCNASARIDPDAKIKKLMEPAIENPFWIPDAQMGTQCNKPEPCPFSEYCKSKLPADAIELTLPYTPITGHGSTSEKSLLHAAGLDTMSDIMEYVYCGGDLNDIPLSRELSDDGSFAMSERSQEMVMAWSRRLREMK